MIASKLIASLMMVIIIAIIIIKDLKCNQQNQKVGI